MAIRASPLMGLGALLQGYDQQRSEDQRRRAYEEQLRQAALLRASQGAIGATLTAPGGIGGGIGSSPYAGLANLAGGGAQPPLSPQPLSAPDSSYQGGTPSPDIGSGPPGNVSIDNIGLGPKASDGYPGNPVTADDAGVMDLTGTRVPPPVPQTYQQPPGSMRNLQAGAAGAPATLDQQPVPGGARPMPPPGPYLGSDGQLHPPPPGMGGAAARPPVAPQQVPPQRPPMAPQAAPQMQPSPAQGGGQQQPFNPADLLNPERGLEFASTIAQRVKAANPNAPNEVIAQATVDLMKAVAVQDRLGVSLAIQNMKNVATGQHQQAGFDEKEKLQANTFADRKERQQAGFGEREKLQQTGIAARKQMQDQRLAAQQQRYATLDAQKEQARKDAIARGDRSTYIRVLTAQLAEIRSQLGNMMRMADMSPEEKQAAQAKEKELTDELGRLQGQTRPQ